MGYLERVCLTLVISLAGLGIHNVSGTLVSTESGIMEGTAVTSQSGDVYQFRKIPYAKPPVGSLRFSKPMKISPWNTTLNATEYGPACIQPVARGSNFSVSEDCLFLNIFVPNEISTSANKSVMVWIHGGGFTQGTGMSYDGTSLALHGDVIVVTLNYRLGVFGFLSTGDSSARGNYGHWDQIEALKWIKTNIKYFGGNPDSITLFGGSAGALSVSLLAMIPENKGLFHRVITQSGSFGSYKSITSDSGTNARVLGGLLQCSNNHSTESLVTCFREKDAVALSNPYESSDSLPKIGNTLSYGPVIDGEMLTSNPFSLLQNQSSEEFKFYRSLDIISGCNSAEGSLSLVIIPNLPFPAFNISEGIPSWILKLFAEAATEDLYSNDTRILPYIYDKYISTDMEEQGRLFLNYFGDVNFYVPMMESLLVHDRGRNSKTNTFQYFFSKSSAVDFFSGVLPKWFVGAGHGDEVPYIFKSGQGLDTVLSAQMMSYWTNFAKYGNPNTGLPVPVWPEFDENARRFINLDTDITTGTDLLGDRIRFWTDEIPRIMSETEILIDIPMGPIKGIVQTVKGSTINQFRKIPFAKAPTGPLRFAKPVSISNWTGTLDATRFGPSCIQTMDPSMDTVLPNSDISEDCLFLNIYVPNEVSMAANKSVMVWIHGGGFTQGTGMTYDGTSLALHGDVIVVTLNYRLGVFGFLSTGDSSARGNYGLWDQIEALKWIKRNIKYFGGNPDSITLFGESAGAFSISHLAVIPGNKGLFHRVIMQSGSLSSFGSIMKDPLTKARAFGSFLGCTNPDNTTSLLSCLRAIDSSELQSGADVIYSAIASLGGIFELSLSPVIDGELISSHPLSVFQNQSSEQFAFYQSLDVISGCNSAEGSVFLFLFEMFPYLSLPAVNISDGIPSWTFKLIAQAVTEAYYNNDTRILQHIYKKYMSTDEEEQGRRVMNLLGDITFYIPMWESLLVHDRGGNSIANTFQYFFSKKPLVDVIGVFPKWFKGAGHAAEINFLFDNWGYLHGDDKDLSMEMMTYWTNFAHYGNPNTGLPVPVWPEFDENATRFINLDTDITTGTDLLGDRIRFWTDEIPRIMSETEILIDIPMGPIKGIVQTVKGSTINQFRKIPFAKAPTGPLRFAKPVSISNWTGTLDATRFGPSCIQTMDPSMDTVLPNSDISEDCLFLNIYVPNEVSMTANKSVMVWIHGGGFTQGTGMTYDGTSLALHGDVIVVTLNYRLGVFGFLSTGDSSARGNYGHWDQIEALKWIKTNIKYFGGNPDSITLFGGSAGALSVSLLAMIPENRGLFHRVVTQSGSFGSYKSITSDSGTNARVLGGLLQCSNNQSTESLVTCFREKDAVALSNPYESSVSLPKIGNTLSYGPVIDGEMLTSNPFSLLQNQSSEEFKFYRSLDIISGCNSAEGSLSLVIIPNLPFPAFNISEGIPSWILKLFAEAATEDLYSNDTRILPHIYDKYISTDMEEQGRLFLNYFGDVNFYVPMMESLLVHDRGRNSKTNTFQYFFSKSSAVDFFMGVLPKWFVGAGHGDEVPYIFKSGQGLDTVLSAQMMSYWTNFAKYGNPNTGLPVPVWPEFDENARRFINLDTDITTGTDLLGDRIRFWTDEIPRIMSETEILIDIPMGPIKGIVQTVKGSTINQFRKIPFAKAPTGPLRFAKPVSISNWTGTLDATRFGPSCIQTMDPSMDTVLPNSNISEDCLFLNIYVPNEVSMTANKSVMVWIHGGGFTQGTGMTYDGTSLALHGDVIVATLNYRLGVFGFLSTGDSSARGNYGLWDQIEALKWIKTNIKYFGGNPDSITLFGESAGAFSISHLAVIPGNKGLFHRVIMQSGSLSSFGSITKDPLTKSRAFGSFLGCTNPDNTTSLVSCLRAIDSSELQSGADVIYSAIASLGGIFELSLSPVIDGELISTHPLSVFQNQSSEQFAFYQSLDVISGCNSAEGSVFLFLFEMFPYLSLPAVNISNGIPSWTFKLIAQAVTEAYYNNDTRILQHIYKKYISTDEEEQGRRVMNILGDITFYIPMWESLLVHDRGGNSIANTFQYFFSKKLLVDVIGVFPKWFKGAGHAAEINFLFDNWGYLHGDDKDLSMEMMSYWTNFAHYGNPNTGLPVPVWPEFDENATRFINLDADITTGTDLLGDRIRFWTDEIPRIMSETEILIDIPMGPIKGIVQTVKGSTINQFRKIPFAKAPTGPLRFAKPVSISNWTGTLDATRFGPSCIQTMYPSWDTVLPNSEISEDCLFLNIYVPNEVSMTANKSVMVWIHGGGFTLGSGMSYDGTSLALHGDVIVVTLNYRLGVFGFLSTGDSSARGNYGLWDQIEALKWIKTNIKYFGGNPDSITLFGESAGAFSISHLAVIPGNKGLFHRVIMQSGSLSSFGSITTDPLTKSRAFGSFLGCTNPDNTTSLVSCLRAIDSSELQSGTDVIYSAIASLGSIFEFSLSPVIDGELISSDLLSVFQNQSSEQFAFYQSLDVISGCNSAEGSVFLFLFEMFPYLSLPAVNISNGIPSWTFKLIAQAVTEAYYNNDTRILQHVYKKYMSTDEEEQGRRVMNLLGDITFYIPMWESLLVHDRGGNSIASTFQYFFDQPVVDPMNGIPPKWFKGAGHFAEVNFLFDNWVYLQGDDKELSMEMMSYWTNFAHYGNPNTGLPVPVWPEFDENARRFINLDTDITTGTDLLGDRIRFWTDEIPRIMSETEILIDIPMGPIKGIVQTVKGSTINQFRKIPFAKAPTGPLRFAKPVSISNWTGTLDATRFGPSCIQTMDPSMDTVLPNSDISEDCLFLNIYVPNEVSMTANKSVMVWIHGGGFTQGTGMTYDGTSLALHGDVIVVTLNYRLGVFGFLSTGDSSARGNYGLWDQIEALKWIKTNIKYFGGNPDSITLFGESAGAFSISHLAVIPGNKGLFHRVIMQSGSLSSFGSITKDPLTKSRAFGSFLGCTNPDNTTSLVSCLRAIDSSELQSGADVIYSAIASLGGIFELSLSPVIDGELISTHPLSVFQNQSLEQFAFYQSLDVISGCNSAEGSVFLFLFEMFPYLSLPAVNISNGIPSWTFKLIAQAVTEAYYNNDTRILQHIYKKYISTDEEEQGRRVMNILGDITFYIPMWESLLVHDRGGNSIANTFQYFFSKKPLVDVIGVFPKWFKGAGHAAEINFLFDNWGYLHGDDKDLSMEMMSYWTNFAHYGNPNTGLPVPVWPEFDENATRFINLDADITTGTDLLGDRIRFWTDEIPRIMSETEILIDIPMGPIKGIVQTVKGSTINQFRKIPFAKAPTGPLRFAKPVSISNWTGTLDATRFGPSCIQTMYPSWDTVLPNSEISEDCLFLNIYVPNEVSMTANKSVMVWIHGGGFTLGSGMSYDGTSLALHGDVIVVTLNYRLGVFGFLSTGDSSARGNYGLWDQIEALKWIKTNIKYFGGNPDSITLFGESAGAFSISHLAVIPGNKGLFHRVIMQSGSLSSFGSITKDPLTKSRAFGSFLGCTNPDNTTSLVSCLRAIDSSELQSGTDVIYSAIASLGSIFEFSLSPVIDGELISSDLLSVFQNQSSEQLAFYQSLDVISGCNSAEGSVFLFLFEMFPYLSLPAVNISDGIPSWTFKLIAQAVTEAYYNNDTRILQHVYKKYMSTDEEEQGRRVMNLLGDITFYIPMWESLLVHDRGGNSIASTFQYFFDQPVVDPMNGIPPKWFKGAGHFAEVNFLFDNWVYLQGDDKELSMEMMSYWTNFAHYGNPNTGLPVPVWPEFDENARRFINLDTDITTGTDLLGDRIRFWTDEIPRIMSETEILIDIPMGPIKGIVQTVKGSTINQFRKIPFAKAPTGPLRFAKPVSISNWTGTLDATRFGPSCIQTMDPSMDTVLPNSDISEDCLFLNIYVPNEVSMTANKSVMVWIHGGGFTQGTGMTYDGTSLALHGDVIVVTLNYRLGVFGFLSTGDSSARGNYGLWDQIEALKWIKTNIKYFGGNPDSITLFGESAGAFSISHLAVIPGNKGLFHRVIMQSGSLSSFGSITKDPLTKSRAFGSFLGCTNPDNTTSLVSCLRAIDSSELQSGADVIYSAIASLGGIFELSLSPVIDGELISTHPLSVFQNQSSEQFAFYQSLDVISGCNSAEGSVFLFLFEMFPYLSLPAVNISDGIPSWTFKLIAQAVTEAYYNNDTRILQHIYKKYMSTDEEEQGRRVMNILGDITFYIPMWESLLVHDRGGNSIANTFQYFFSKKPLVDVIGVFPKWFKGAGHAAEINFLFDNWGYLHGDDKDLSMEMMSYWTNFAHYGNPNTGLPVPVWPEFDENATRFINLDADITTGTDLLGDRIRFWTDEIPRIMSETEILIDIPMGPIKGIVQTVKGSTINQFRKIPFAKAPTGPLRFAKPVSISNWTGTLDATRFGPSCIQTMYPSWDTVLPNSEISEDCLFLNIYVPNEVSMTANKSVMVWIHGGGFTLGSGMSYDGTSLALHGDVIVVTLNYRLGVFGFLSTGDSSARGNYGLWDQIEALKWIKTNIKYFGGNPDSITLFGESAGAFSISHLAVIPGNKGLFHRVIMQSGSLSSFGSITKDPLTKSRAFGSFLGCTNTDNTTSLVSCLRAIDSSELQSGTDVIYSAIASLGSIFEFSLSPVIDGELISSDLLSVFQNQSSEQFAFYQSLDVISGCNSAEGSVFLFLFEMFPYLSLPAVNISDGIPSWTFKLIAQAVTEAYYNNDTRILQHVYKKYMSTDEEEQGRRVMNLLGDITFYIPMWESLLVHDRGGNSIASTFQYFFDQPVVDPMNGIPPKWFKGAGHFAEVNFLFDNWVYLQGDDKELSMEMMSYWTNFAHYGNPNTGLPVPVWPEFDENATRFINLDADITTGTDLLGDRIRFWTDEIPRIMSETEILIDIPMGPIKGISQTVKGSTINQFRKIPFAKAPTGPLRFAKPVSISNWTGTLDATRFGPSCIQTMYPSTDTVLPNSDISEDCLFLNIYVPNDVSMTANKSVMVWIHGGGYESGSGMSYDGTSLALHGDVIVVTLNYRLGVFGFLSTGDSSARGNYGLWDQIEALKWIKTNIKYFGGNPDSITLFGESAGAFSISHLAVIPGNKGLFHRVIMQSGSLSSFGSITKDPLTKSRAFGSFLGCTNPDNTTSLVSCLRAIDSSELQSGADVIYSAIASLGGIFELSLSPVIDGELISSHPLSVFQNEFSEQLAFYKSLDVISGCNSAEGSVFLMLFQMFPYLSLPAVNISDGIPSWAFKLFAQAVTEVYYNNDTRILQPIYDKYISSTDEEEQGRHLVNLLGDIIFYIPMWESLLVHDRGGNSITDTFQYFFSNQPVVDPVIGIPPKWFKGAGHFAEVNFLFDNWGYLQGDDKELSMEMMSYWTNFAHYGNPNTGLPVPVWPEFDENARRFINLDADITTGSDLLGDRIRFWTDEIPRIMSGTGSIVTTTTPDKDISNAPHLCASYIIVFIFVSVSVFTFL